MEKEKYKVFVVGVVSSILTSVPTFSTKVRFYFTRLQSFLSNDAWQFDMTSSVHISFVSTDHVALPALALLLRNIYLFVSIFVDFFFPLFFYRLPFFSTSYVLQGMKKIWKLFFCSASLLNKCKYRSVYNWMCVG